MPLRPDAIRGALAGADHPLGVRELLRAAGLHPGHQTDLKRVLRELVRSGELRKEGKRYLLATRSAEVTPAGQPSGRGTRRRAEPRAVATNAPRLAGVLHAHPDGFGFVHPDDASQENVFLPPEQAARALDNDRVLVEIVPGRGGRTAGRLVKVLERRRQLVVGTYVARPGGAWVDPVDSALGRIAVMPTQLSRTGDVVKVRLGVGSGMLAGGEGLFGEVAGSLGKPGDLSTEVLSIAYGQGFHDEFSAEVMDEADAIAPSVSEAEAAEEGRRDLRTLELVTIDGEDARDFDDAIFVEDHPEGWRLVVAIADVSHYVRVGSALDGEALRRATSVYLPGRVLPMLPERLSNGICSLKPDVDRLCMVADMVVDRRGHTRRAEVYPAVMRSAARCTYTEVHSVLAGEDVPHRAAFRPLFLRAQALAEVLRAMRTERGAIDFDLPETRIELDEQGQPLRMVRRERWESHRLVEECMLAANEAVARYFQQEGLPCVYRYHAEPDEEKLAAFAALAQAHGFHLPRGEVRSKDLNNLLEKLEDHPEQRALNQLLLRSMMQAVYTSKSVGHYGLGAQHYLHFTSPIRRYPDLLVHRLLKEHWAHEGRARRGAQRGDQLEAMAEQSSQRERAAMQVEREVISLYAAVLMKDRLGEQFEGTVSGLAEFGFFVELDGLFIDGLVRADDVEPRSRLDPVAHALVFGSGRRVRVGQRVRVRLASVNTARRQIDLSLVDLSAGPAREAGGQPERLPAAPAALAPASSPEAPDGSPHPGFDRLRALALRAGKLKPAPRPASSAPGAAFGSRRPQRSNEVEEGRRRGDRQPERREGRPDGAKKAGRAEGEGRPGHHSPRGKPHRSKGGKHHRR